MFIQSSKPRYWYNFFGTMIQGNDGRRVFKFNSIKTAKPIKKEKKEKTEEAKTKQNHKSLNWIGFYFLKNARIKLDFGFDFKIDSI